MIKEKERGRDDEGELMVKKLNIDSVHFEWANGSETIKNVKDVKKACSMIKTSPTDILTGFLVRVMFIQHKPIYKHSEWSYWDAEMFWKCLKRKPQ